MGLIKAAVGALGGTLADQWREYVYCDSLPENVLAEILEVSAPEDAAQLALSIPSPGTARVVLEGCVPFGVLWKYAPMENLEQGVALTRTEEQIDKSHEIGMSIERKRLPPK